MEAGKTLQPDQLVHEYNTHCRATWDRTPDVVTCPLRFMEPKDRSQESFVKSKTGKQPGPTGIRHELLKIAAPGMANLLCPLFINVTVQGTEPISWKGGWAGGPCPQTAPSVFCSRTTVKSCWEK
eukprot:4518165-Pyramimonas_sp.AAC.1